MSDNDTPQAQTLPVAPTPPEDWECCGSECGEFCVYEIYAREKQDYDAAMRALAANKNT